MKHSITRLPKNVRLVRSWMSGQTPWIYEGPASRVVFDELPDVKFAVAKIDRGWIIREETTGKSALVSGLHSSRAKAITEQAEAIQRIANSPNGKKNGGMAYARKLFAEVMHHAKAP